MGNWQTVQSRSDAAECGICSGSPLFAKSQPFFARNIIIRRVHSVYNGLMYHLMMVLVLNVYFGIHKSQTLETCISACTLQLQVFYHRNTVFLDGKGLLYLQQVGEEGVLVFLLFLYYHSHFSPIIQFPSFFSFNRTSSSIPFTGRRH